MNGKESLGEGAKPQDGPAREAGTGNASNPPADAQKTQPNQILGRQAEQYLREAGNIEDIPDARDQQQADDRLKEGQAGSDQG